MTSLLDIAPPEIQAKEIDVRGIKLRIRGIAARDWATLYARFPGLKATIEGRSGESMSRLTEVQMQAAVIAAATGQLGNSEIERAALQNLTAQEARAIVDEAVQLSMPGHVFGPLLEGAGTAAAVGTNSPPPSGN